MKSYSKHFKTDANKTCQEPLTGRPMVANNTGGMVFQLDNWARLRRFLILGAEGNTYYSSERKQVTENVGVIKACMAENPLRLVQEITKVSVDGVAPKNDPAILALALSLAEAKTEAVKNAIADAVPQVCRIGTHLFKFTEMVDKVCKWRGYVKKAVNNWYRSKPAKDLAYQVAKYQSREGWSHKDVLSLCHPKLSGDSIAVSYWCRKGWSEVGEAPHPSENLRLLWAVETVKKAKTVKEVVKLIEEYRLSQEMVPTSWHKEPTVWEALKQHMGPEAMIRNLARLTASGLLKNLSKASKFVVNKLNDHASLQAKRIHPLFVLNALRTYQAGHGDKGSLTWTPVQNICDALDEAFYGTFKSVEPTGLNWLLGVDCSSSMGSGKVGGSNLTPIEAAAAMALVTANTEANYYIMGFANSMKELAISPKDRIDKVTRTMLAFSWGSTRIALPMEQAKAEKLDVDVFVTYTDNEINTGGHPVTALREYRKSSGNNAKCIVAAFTATAFTVADPNDPGMLDVVGFDSSAPKLMSEFALGRV